MSKAGWVVKEGGKIKTWKKRWMALEGDVLSYYKKETKKEKCGEIRLADASEIAIERAADYKKHANCFKIVTADRVYHICTDDEPDMSSWIEVLNKQKSGSASGPPSVSHVATNGNSHHHEDPEPSSANEKKMTVEDFSFLKVIGKGSFGKVLLVRKRDTNKVYAMKVLTKSKILKKNEVGHTKSEKAILVKLHNPFLVKLHYSFQDSDRLFFVMDYVNGGELFFHLQKEKRFTEDRVKFYTAEIVLGIEYLHKNGVIYRDLKPENLLLTRYGHIIMTDFGLSKEGLHTKDARTATFCGTPEYLAPEVLEGNGYSKAIDWWSFGTLMFEMLTGLPPFYCEDVQQMYTKIMTADLQFPDVISDTARDLLSKLLEREPARRLVDPAQIKAHPFYASIDWTKLENLELEPPFKPQVKDDLDIANIDTMFTDEPVTLDDDDEDEDSEEANTPANNGNSDWDGFTYNPANAAKK
jgi:serine/threonine protein kinase